jgi:hypothetical protein
MRASAEIKNKANYGGTETRGALELERKLEAYREEAKPLRNAGSNPELSSRLRAFAVKIVFESASSVGRPSVSPRLVVRNFFEHRGLNEGGFWQTLIKGSRHPQFHRQRPNDSAPEVNSYVCTEMLDREITLW